MREWINIILESTLMEKRSAPLFHGTSIAAAVRIIEENALGKTGTNAWANQVSLSRSYGKAWHFATHHDDVGCVLVLDQAKIATRYKIAPFHDTGWQDDGIYGADPAHPLYDEREEIVKGIIRPLSSYLISVNLDPVEVRRELESEYFLTQNEDVVHYLGRDMDQSRNRIEALLQHPKLNTWLPRSGRIIPNSNQMWD